MGLRMRDRPIWALCGAASGLQLGAEAVAAEQEANRGSAPVAEKLHAAFADKGCREGGEEREIARPSVRPPLVLEISDIVDTDDISLLIADWFISRHVG